MGVTVLNILLCRKSQFFCPCCTIVPGEKYSVTRPRLFMATYAATFYDFNMFRTSGSEGLQWLQWVFRTYNTVSSTSKSFQLAQDGDIDCDAEGTGGYEWRK